MYPKFKLIAYPTKRSFDYQKDYIEFTDIETLLTYLNKSTYYDYIHEPVHEVTPNEDWDIAFKHVVEYNPIYHWEIKEYPEDNGNMRIIGIDFIYAQPQKSGIVIYDNIDCRELQYIPKSNMCLITMTISDFLKSLSLFKLNLERYDYIALKSKLLDCTLQ